MLATLKCLKKINFFDWLIAEINKFKFTSGGAGRLLLDLQPGDYLRRKHLAALLSLTQFLCIGHGELFLGDLFSFQEKIDNYKTLHQLIKFCLQTNFPELQPTALAIVELLLTTIQRLQTHEAPDHHRAVFAAVLADLFSQTRENAEVWIPLLERLMIFREMTLLKKLNENCEVYELLLQCLDLRGAKLRSVACLQLFRVLVSRAPNAHQAQCDHVVFGIYSALSNFVAASRRESIFTALYQQLRALVVKYRSGPKFSVIVARLHPELMSEDTKRSYAS